MRAKLVLFVVLLLAVASYAAGPGPAIGAARNAIHDQRYAEAVKLLQDAVPDAAAIPDERERSMALSAIHFYSAVAFAGLGDEWKTKEELEQFFHFSPQTNTIDPSKYDARLVGYFNEVRDSLRQEASTSFDAVYPGYRTFSDDSPKTRPLSQWGDGPELTLLGAREEKTEWRRLTDDDARSSFIDRFWFRRDPAYRQAFTRRVAFADQTFANERTRGSLTDRGRVFVLLGAPRVVKQKPLSAREAGSLRSSGPAFAATDASAANRFRAMQVADANLGIASSVPIAKANIERWIFSRDQLPASVAQAEVVFKFITEEGYGDHVLQREFLVTKALADAPPR